VKTPKRFAYWVIVAGAQPTAFRSRYVDDLVPTLKQLQRTQPTAELRWFERGRFWLSPAAAKAASRAKRATARDRDADWRPGGVHKDPRARFKLTRDEKRAKFKRRSTGSTRASAARRAKVKTPRGSK
jgi:hypothetical protein